MMMKEVNRILSIIAICLLAYIQMPAQEVQWADSLIYATSDMSHRVNEKLAYTGKQALGKPSVMPNFGETPCAWTPDMSIPKLESIKVSFANPQYVRQIMIYENYYPGAISKVYIYDEQNKETMVFSNPVPKPGEKKGRMKSIVIDKTVFKVKYVKVEVSTEFYNEWYQIDAIGISDSDKTYEVSINLPGKNVVYFKPENLGTNINSPTCEITPVISPDGKHLFFTRDGHPDNIGKMRYQDIWYSTLDSSGKFKPALNIGPPINNASRNFVLSVSPDGNSLVIGNVYLPDGTLVQGLSQSYLDSNGWRFPEKLNIKDYYNTDAFGSFSLASDGRTLLLSIKRLDGWGGTDIYMSQLQADATWSVPKNLGKQINTATDEDTPFLAADGKTLYYSTSGLLGFGSNDMFMSTRLDDTWQNWSAPVNLGAGINSEQWDAYYTITADGEYAYFVSGNNTYGLEDIFRVKLPKEIRPEEVVIISGRVLNANTKQPLEAKIVYESLPDGKQLGSARSNPKTGEFAITLPKGKKYGIMAQAEAYVSVNEYIDLTSLHKFEKISKDLLLAPIQKGQVVRINNIFFEFGKFDLLPASYPELERLLKLLKVEPKMQIFLKGHTDNVGYGISNRLLSQNRAKAVVDYLVKNGIDASRIKFEGYGATKPIATNDTDEGRAKNRRVEFEIINAK